MKSRVVLALLCICFIVSCASSLYECNNNGVCDLEIESCLSCPSDCSCLFSGLKLTSYHDSFANRSSTNTTSSAVRYPELSELTYGKVVAQMTGYFQVSTDKVYWFNIIGSNVGVAISIDNNKYTNAYFVQKVINSYFPANLNAGQVYKVTIDFFTLSGQYSFSLLQSPDSGVTYQQFSSLYYYEGNQVSAGTVQKPVNTTCGSGICTETNPNACLFDCYQFITPFCPAQATPQPPTGSAYKFDDSFGSIIKNQYNLILPGVDVMAHGVNIVTGDPNAAPLFSFNYCDNTSYTTIQDNYRGNVYTVPGELQAQVYTSCTYDTSVSIFESSQAMARSKQVDTAIDASVSVNVGFGGIGGGVNGAYSKEQSVLAASEMETTHKGSVVEASVKCFTSKIHMTSIKFHPMFLKDLAHAMDGTDMLGVVFKYGSHYYKNAKMGGKLSQITVMDSSAQQTMTNSQISQSVSYTVGASVSSPAFSASAEVKKSQDSELTQDAQNKFLESSVRSNVLTYGGAPGSYGPGRDSAPSSFGDWAKTVDVLPVPVDYELDAVSNIIPAEWKTPYGHSVLGLWRQAEAEYYSQLGVYPYVKQAQYVLAIYFTHSTSASHSTTDTTKITFGGSDTANVVTSVLMQNSTSNTNTYLPATWVAAEASLSPRFFTFYGVQINNITYLNVSLNSGIGNDMGLAYMELVDVTLSKRYRFDVRQEDKATLATATHVTLIPYYNYGKIVAQISLALEDSSISINYDRLILTIKGTMNSKVFTKNLNDIPNMDWFEVSATADQPLGLISSITMRLGVARNGINQRSPTLKVFGAYVTYTACSQPGGNCRSTTGYFQGKTLSYAHLNIDPTNPPLVKRIQGRTLLMNLNPYPCTDCNNGNGICTVIGCICNNGYSGRFCNNPICDTNCYGRGTCKRPNKCEGCQTGWKGDDCNTPICSTNCHGRGKCDKPEKCIQCTGGWAGDDCNTPTCSQTCHNGGRCVRPNECECPHPWEGHDCKKYKCTCDGLGKKCTNGGGNKRSYWKNKDPGGWHKVGCCMYDCGY